MPRVASERMYMPAQKTLAHPGIPLLLSVCLTATIAGGAFGAGKGLQAILEMHSALFKTQEPVEVRFSIWNDGETEAKGLPAAPLTRYFQLYDADGKALPAAKDASVDAPRPPSLPPGGHYGLAFDLAKLFPQLRNPGTYRIAWSAAGLISNQAVLKIVPAYDPKRNYVGIVETNSGTIRIKFFPDKAPLAVKNFIELANSGFYDGTRIHYVEPGRLIAGGDRNGTGGGTPGYTYPVEVNELEFLAGTMAMRHAGNPPTNGSQFFILAAPRVEYAGRYTAFAQVVSGLEIVQQISQIPNSGRQTDPPNQPLSDVIVTRVTISEAKE